ncbi:hypothetical protein BSL78_20092 [Apostichopus japonicus]|uniref:Tesmin/TSO1-like CXC domain-containing protein n=1 Tax=Stichopus japonicus TaxID=307972 RepID=A0A2G8K538_STIJA|nr:hypothetical protein BSL78_20092 [Apostichopus japonicus]
MAELKQFPPDILSNFKKGAFAVSISGNDGCSVAFDEAHEMLINKEFKMAMTTTGMGSMSRLLHYLPYRARVLKNLKSEIQCTDKSKRSQESLPLSLFKSHEANVVQYFGKLTDAGLLFNEGPQPDRIHHIFTGEISSEVVSQDLQTFYDKGEEDLVAFIRCVVLNTSGTKPPKRSRRNLKTFTVKKKSIQKQSYEIKDQKLQILSLRRQVALSKHQISLLSVYTNLFPFHVPFVVQMDYPSKPYRRWVVKAMREFNACEIHIVFDHPGRHGCSPKDIERVRRDGTVEEALYTEILPETLCPSNWRKFLCVRSQKRLLVNFLSMELLHIAEQADTAPIILITAGGFDGDNTDQALSVSKNNPTISVVSELTSNHEEGDSRVWFHTGKTTCERVVIYSPDRDTFHVGLPLMSSFTSKQVYVQLRAAKNDNLFIDMNVLINLLTCDVSLQKVGPSLIDHIPTFFQTLYVVSGCDFTSFFKGHSKKGFLDVFFRDCEFITGPDACGKLDDFRHSEVGLLAFYRLIGSVYFRKHCSAFEAESPRELLLSLWLTEKSNLENHTTFLESIRNGHFHRISGESEWMPSTDALRLHWQRCCWVLTVWAHACSSNVTVPELTSHGWTVANDKVSVVWDTEVNLEKVNRNIQHLKEGCKCKKGCTRNWCKCRKDGKICSIFCQCQIVRIKPCQMLIP